MFKFVSLNNIFGGLATAATLVYFSIGSSFFIQPVSLTYDEDSNKFTFVRTLRASVRADWNQEIIVQGEENLQCFASGTAEYDKTYEPVSATYYADLSLLPCLQEVKFSRVSITTLQVILFGILPLRSAKTVEILPGYVKEESRPFP